MRGNQKQVCSNHAADSRLSEWGNSSCASRYKGVTANLFQVQNSEFRSGTMQEKVNLYPCSFYIKKKTIVKIVCWPTGHGNVILLPLFSPIPPPHTFSSSYSPSFIFTIVALLHLKPLPLSLLLSVVQCQSPHSACLQAVFLICLNYSRHFLLFVFFFFFFLPDSSSKLYKPEKKG